MKTTGERLPVLRARRIVVVAVAGLLSAACSAPSFSPAGLQQRTAPTGTTAGAITELERTAFSVRFSWDVRTPGSWVEYRAEMLQEFSSEFAVISGDASSLVLSRRDGGDVYRIEFRPASTDGTRACRLLGVC